MIRVLALATVLATLCPALSAASETTSLSTRVATLTPTLQSQPYVPPRPGLVRSACTRREGAPCGDRRDPECCPGWVCINPRGHMGGKFCHRPY
jgi:hypothetical protein